MAGTAKSLSVERWIGIAADIGVVAGIAVAILTYFGEKQDSDKAKAREATLHFAALRHGFPYAESSAKLFDRLWAKGDLLLSDGGQADARRNDAEALVKDMGAGTIDGLAMFYSAVIDCEQSGVCDEPTGKTLFDGDIRSFYCATYRDVLPIVLTRMNEPQRYERLKVYFDKNIRTCPKVAASETDTAVN